jgi:hypothetical protein
MMIDFDFTGTLLVGFLDRFSVVYRGRPLLDFHSGRVPLKSWSITIAPIRE